MRARDASRLRAKTEPAAEERRSLQDAYDFLRRQRPIADPRQVPSVPSEGRAAVCANNDRCVLIGVLGAAGQARVPALREAHTLAAGQGHQGYQGHRGCRGWIPLRLQLHVTSVALVGGGRLLRPRFPSRKVRVQGFLAFLAASYQVMTSTVAMSVVVHLLS